MQCFQAHYQKTRKDKMADWKTDKGRHFEKTKHIKVNESKKKEQFARIYFFCKQFTSKHFQ